MTITRIDAAQALADIRNTQTRGKAAHLYRSGGSALILWGMIWLIAYTVTGLLPGTDWWMAWVPGNIIGAAGTAWLSRNGALGKSARIAWTTVLAAISFLVGLYLVNPPRTANQADVLPALVVALLYVVLGAAWLTRYALIGAALFAATLAGYFLAPDILPFWMAVVGGGALITGGLWLRQA